MILRSCILLIISVSCSHTAAKMIRNQHLMNQMMTHFQRDHNLSLDPQAHTTKRPKPKDQESQKPEKVVALMQSVLCKNFPSIPCKVIMRDATLNKLITRSIQQISKKQKTLDRSFLLDQMSDDKDQIEERQQETPVTQSYMPITKRMYPVVNSEDLSHFLAVAHTGYFKPKAKSTQKRKKKHNKVQTKTLKNYWSQEKKTNPKIKDQKEGKHIELYKGRKKMRKFYPHKVSKDKTKAQGEYREFSDEKLSISVEVPDMKMPEKSEPMTFKVEPSESPVWRLDYMKHGVPGLNMFGYEDERLTGKLIKNGANNVEAEEYGLQAARKDVLHSDVYIKKNFARKNTVNMDSDVIDN